jgi:hypothetical protein
MKQTPFYQSKTLGVATLNVAILHFYPGAKEWVALNPEAYAEILTFSILLLRTLTTKAIKWKVWKKHS